jgi:hypothetical protein
VDAPQEATMSDLIQHRGFRQASRATADALLRVIQRDADAFREETERRPRLSASSGCVCGSRADEPDARDLLARITGTAEDLYFTEAHLRRQRTILREQATALRLGESPAVVVARLKAARCWTLGSVEAQAS